MPTTKLQRMIRRARPNISDGSIKTYMSSLRIMRKRLPKAEDTSDASFLLDYEKVMEAVAQDKKINTQKNRLTAIIVALSSQYKDRDALKEKYTADLKKLNEQYFAYLRTQKKTETQRKNWISYKQVIDIANDLTNSITKLDLGKRARRSKLTKKEFDALQQYTMLRTYLVFPIRNDFADMRVVSKKRWDKIPEGTRGHVNYLILLPDNKKEFHINQFKNRRFIGAKILKVPPKLNRVLNTWLKFNKSGYLFVQLRDKSKPLTPNALTRYMNKIFAPRTGGKKISTSMLRHIIISHMLEGKQTLLEKDEEDKKIKNRFFHSSAVNQLYRKVD